MVLRQDRVQRLSRALEAVSRRTACQRSERKVGANAMRKHATGFLHRKPAYNRRRREARVEEELSAVVRDDNASSKCT